MPENFSSGNLHKNNNSRRGKLEKKAVAQINYKYYERTPVPHKNCI